MYWSITRLARTLAFWLWFEFHHGRFVNEVTFWWYWSGEVISAHASSRRCLKTILQVVTSIVSDILRSQALSECVIANKETGNFHSIYTDGTFFLRSWVNFSLNRLGRSHSLWLVTYNPLQPSTSCWVKRWILPTGHLIGLKDDIVTLMSLTSLNTLTHLLSLSLSFFIFSSFQSLVE